MIKKINDKNKSFRFRRYSRNGYAVFLSLNKVITIGKLANYIADKGLSKSAKLNSITNTNNPNSYFEDDPPDNQLDDNIILNIYLQIIITNFIENKNIEQYNCTYNKCKILTLPIFRKTEYRFFFN